MSWTKLELEEQERREELRLILEALTAMGNLDISSIERSYGLPSYPGVDPMDIVTDYLTLVRNHIWTFLGNKYGTVYLDITPIDLVITIPAVNFPLLTGKTPLC